MAKPTHVGGLGPDTPLNEAGRRFVLGRLADVRRHERSAAACKTEAVHDMRVAARRLRAAVQLFSPKRHGKLEKRIKRVQDALGDVRDLQIQLAWFRTLRGDSLLTRLVQDLEKGLADKKQKLRSVLEEWQQSTAPTMKEHASSIKGKSRLGAKRMRKRLATRLVAVAEELEALRRSPDPQQAHRVRIEVKKLRYETELLSPAWGSGTAAILEPAIKVQQALGELHDLDVRSDLIRQTLAPEKGSPPQALLTALRSVERQRRDQAAKLDALLRTSSRSLTKLRGRLLREFGEPPRTAKGSKAAAHS